MHFAPFGQARADFPATSSGAQLRQIVETRISDRFCPPHVVVNSEGEIVHFSPRTRKFLEAPPGAPSRQLLTSALKELRLDLRSALREAVETRRTVTRENILFDNDQGVAERVSLTVESVPYHSGAEPLFLVVFEERGPAEKPFDDETLFAAVRAAIALDAKTIGEHPNAQEFSARIATLSPREKDILKALVEGRLNKTMAYDLGISVRTVESHRAHLMEKMQADSLAHLIQMAMLASPATSSAREG